MEKIKKLIAIMLVMILLVCNVHASGQITGSKKNEKKRNYIVHMSKPLMPTSYDQHSDWCASTLKLVSNSAKILYTYKNAVHGFSTSLTATEAQLLSTQHGILRVVQDKKYKLLTTRTPEFLGLDKITDVFLAPKVTSKDIIVGIVDTGVWPESSSFNDAGYRPIPAIWKGKCEEGINFTTSNCNKKLIGARFYLKGYEASEGPINETKECRSPRDTLGHGTHTASIAVGSPVRNASLFGYALGTARGMAVGARVAIYKACWNTYCLGVDTLAAIDQAIADNVNVISLSIGDIAVDYVQDNIAIGAFAAMEHGILVSCGGGNRGLGFYSVTNIAPWITTVGAGTLDRDFPAYITLGNGQNYSGVSLFSGSSLTDTPLPIIYAGNASIHDFERGEAARCVPDRLAKEKVAGKIVMCDSGFIDPTEKGNVVKSIGGLGMVLASFDFEGDDLELDPHVLPTIVVKFKDGEAIKQYLFSHPNKSMATVVFEGTKFGVELSPVVAGFSLRGPNSITPQILKPDLIAPGVNILAAYSRKPSPIGATMDWDLRRVDFNILSGTSMSCPHVSGLAALIKSVHPEWSPAAIRSALMTTAYATYMNGNTLVDGGSKKPATPFDFGAGHVDPVIALNPGLVYDLTVDDYLSFLCALNYSSVDIEILARRKYTCDPKKQYSVTSFNYPSFAVVFEGKHGALEVKHRRTLTNVGAAGTYKALVKSNAPSVKISVEPELLSFKQNEKKSYVVTFTTSSWEPHNLKSFGSLEWSDGNTVVRSPITFSWI